MKTSLLLFFMGIFFVTAQNTTELNWSTSSGTSLNATINVGDSVKWTWTDSSPHTVESTGGDDSFDSGGTQTGNGEIYEYKFDIVGSTDYICGIHRFTMGGTITVLATASIEDYQTVAFNYSPNPVQDKISINAAINISEIEIYSILGQKMYSQKLNSKDIEIDVSTFTQNLYFAKLRFEDNSYGVFRILKK